MNRLPQNFHATINRLAQTAVGRDWQLYSIMLQHWRDIIGAEWAAQATPTKLTFPVAGRRSDGVLTISLPRGLAMAAQYQQKHIIERLNRFLGAAVISRVLFTHNTTIKTAAPALQPVPDEVQQQLSAAVAEINDPELRQSLLDFGMILAQQPKS